MKIGVRVVRPDPPGFPIQIGTVSEIPWTDRAHLWLWDSLILNRFLAGPGFLNTEGSNPVWSLGFCRGPKSNSLNVYPFTLTYVIQVWFVCFGDYGATSWTLTCGREVSLFLHTFNWAIEKWLVYPCPVTFVQRRRELKKTMDYMHTYCSSYWVCSYDPHIIIKKNWKDNICKLTLQYLGIISLLLAFIVARIGSFLFLESVLRWNRFGDGRTMWF